MKRISWKLVPAFSAALLLFALSNLGMGSDIKVLKADFQQFLSSYIKGIKQENTSFLSTVHPDLPKKMYDFFFNVTMDMMEFAEKEKLQPSITCRKYGVCTVTWPQPNDGWAAQTFIKHEGRWRWLAE